MIENLTTPQKQVFGLVKRHAQQLLDHSPKFKYFTLHGKKHIEGLLHVADLICKNGVTLTSDETFYLMLSICVHDLGMVVPLQDLEPSQIIIANSNMSDPSMLDNLIREQHNDLVDNYFLKHFDFLTSLGLSPSECGIVKEIAKCHRKKNLHNTRGLIRYLGALLRVIDELDIGPKRAPIEVFRNLYQEMDSISCWHWFKHNIVDTWQMGHNVSVAKIDGLDYLNFEIVVRPPNEKSIPYWLTQIKKPINRVLQDEGAGAIIAEKWGVKISVAGSTQSSANPLGTEWEEYEKKAISHGRKIILVIDDEVRKLEDLFLSLSNKYQIMFAPNAKDAFVKMDAIKVDLAIVDSQVSSGKLWTAEETDNFKATGKKICEHILQNYPQTKIGVLTGTRHNITSYKEYKLEFLLKKPIDPEKLEGIINEVLG